MPFVPIIGSSFDAIAAQQQHWTDANISREEEQSKLQNDWLGRVSQMRDQAQQRDFQNQLAVDQNAQQSAIQARQAATQRQQQLDDMASARAFDAQQQGEKIAAEDRRTQSTMDKYDLENKAQAKAVSDAIDQYGQGFAQTYPRLKAQVDAAKENQQSLETQQQRAQKILADWKDDATPAGLSFKAKANAILAQVKTQMPLVEKQGNAAQAALLKLENDIDKNGYAADADSGQIRHNKTGKTWTFAGAVAAAGGSQIQKPPIPTGTGTGTGPAPIPTGPPATTTATNAIPVGVPVGMPSTNGISTSGGLRYRIVPRP